MNKNLKRTICVTTALFLSSFISGNKTVIKRKTPYSNGYVYICDDAKYELIDNPCDVLVIDRRYKKNPDMKVRDSYKIISLEEQEEIIDILLRYEAENPSRWNRSKNSLQNEWFVHNLLYRLGIETNRTRDVDFDNEDEEVFKTKKLKR